MKPDPHIYQLALERLSVAPAESVFIDDFVRNINGARQLGMHAIHFQSRSPMLQALSELLGAG